MKFPNPKSMLQRASGQRMSGFTLMYAMFKKKTGGGGERGVAGRGSHMECLS